ncbi:MAG TPA: ATPase, T2SS/T4P/T4SS family [Gemmatimonadaceae bacterium]|nr:ATPase, T2SS/T4P/T4SS family [Gemmatimonadaceae bacterium]
MPLTPRQDAVGVLGPEQWIVDACRRAGMPAAEAVHGAARQGMPLPPSAWEALVAFGATEADVLAAVCAASATRPALLAPLGPEAAALMPAALAARHGVVPVRLDRGALVVATSNPLHEDVERGLAAALRRRVEIETASPRAIAQAASAIYPDGDAATTRTTPRHSASIPVVDAPWAADPVGAAEQVDRALTEAMRAGASDLHFEPQPDGVVLVRVRLDGALGDVARVPPDLAPAIIRRLKIMARMDIADSLRPQDGRASFDFEGRAVDLRVSTLPLGMNLEKVVVRVLDGATTLRLDQLGFTTSELGRVERVVGMPEGLVLVVGPTGSGKTTTLYSVLRHIARREHNIITVEDPIEYRVEGITQVQVNEKARMTFASALRSILRQDPDVVFVGEIRDAETAEIAIKASMTGHLVLSTLHTADAASTVDRLLGMGVEPAALSTALKGVIAQRLVRRLCAHCARPMALTELPLHQQQLLTGRPLTTLRAPVGCPQCRGTGFHGRTLVSEVVAVVPAIQRAIARHADVTELTQIARECGMHSMWDSGLERVLDGTTSLGELLDNVPAPLDDLAAPGGLQADVDALLQQLLGDATMQAGSAPRPSLPSLEDPANLPVLRESGPGRVAPVRTAIPAGDALRVLLADDDGAARRALADALVGEGLMVLEAADGDAAVTYARRLAPDVVVCEIALPKLDGIGVVQALRGPGAAPVVIYTRQRDAALLSWARELGAAEALDRAIEPSQLAATLRGLVRPVAELVA